MSFYMSAFFTAIAISAVIGALLLIPVIAYQYRKWGTFSLSRVFLLYCFLVYVIALPCYTLTVSSKMDLVKWCAENGGNKPALNPMHTYYDWKKAGIFDNGIKAAVKTFTFQQTVFNVLLFVPIGMFLKRLFNFKWWQALFIGFGISFLIELMQFTGNFCFAPCSYRQADVEDLITNTTGAFVGILLAPLLSIVPGVRLREEDAGNPRPVTALRRIVGTLIDGVLYIGLSAGLSFALSFIFDHSNINFTGKQQILTKAAAHSALALFMFVIVPLRAQGATLGKLAVRVVPRQLASDGNTLTPPSFARASIKLLCGPLIFVALDIMITLSEFQKYQQYKQPLFIAQCIYVLATLMVLVLNTKGISGLVSGLVSADDRAKTMDQKPQEDLIDTSEDSNEGVQ